MGAISISASAIGISAAGSGTGLPPGVAARREAYKCPERIEVVDALPRTKVGKVDKKALRDAAARAVAAPAT